MDKLDLRIIKAVSTVLLQWTATGEKEFNPDYWIYSRCSSIVDHNVDTQTSIDVGLSTKKIDDLWCLELWCIPYGDYDEPGDRIIIAYIPIHDAKRNCWELSEYCRIISELLANHRWLLED